MLNKIFVFLNWESESAMKNRGSCLKFKSPPLPLRDVGGTFVESLFPLQNETLLLQTFFLYDTYFLRYFDILRGYSSQDRSKNNKRTPIAWTTVLLKKFCNATNTKTGSKASFGIKGSVNFLITYIFHVLEAQMIVTSLLSIKKISFTASGFPNVHREAIFFCKVEFKALPWQH